MFAFLLCEPVSRAMIVTDCIEKSMSRKMKDNVRFESESMTT